MGPSHIGNAHELMLTGVKRQESQEPLHSGLMSLILSLDATFAWPTAVGGMTAELVLNKQTA